MAEIDFDLVSPYGETLRLASELGEAGDYRLMNGVAGFGAPPVQVSYAASSGTGARPRHFRVGPRDLVVPIGVQASGRTQMWERQETLEHFCHRLPGLPLPRLRASYDTGRVLELPFVQLGGFEDTYGTDGDRWHVWPLQWQAPHPYWRATQFESFTIDGAPSTVDLLADLSAMILMPSGVFGQINVQNPGKVPVWPRWLITGPFSGATIGGGDDAFTLAAISGGTRLTIARDESKSYTIIDQTGANRYDLLGPAPRFPLLMPGESQMTIELTGTTAASRVVCSFQPEFRSVY